MQPMIIRPYAPADHDALVHFMLELQSHFVAVDSMHEMRSFASLEEARTYFDQALNDVVDMHGACFVAEIDEEIVGFVQGVIATHESDVMHQLGHHHSKDGWIGLLFVDSDVRGQGIGRGLLDKMREYFHSQGCTTMRLKVMSDNVRAVHMYNAYGFKPKDIEMVLPLKKS